jgi:hypothetical protein
MLRSVLTKVQNIQILAKIGEKFVGNWSLSNDDINNRWNYQQEGSIWIYRFF